MNTADIIFILIIVILLIIAVIVLLMIKREEKKIMSVEEKSKKTKDLDKITANIERDYKPINIELTSYEQEQEENAVISYEELKNKSANTTYEELDDTRGVKKIDFNKQIDLEHTQKIEVPLLSDYEKEEAFLKALRQLQRDLAK